MCRLNERTNERTNEQTNKQTSERASARMNKCENERTNERTNLQAILKWNKHNCQNIITGQTYPGLRHPWIIFARHWAKIVVLFTSFWGKWFTGARFAFLGPYIGRHSSVLTWKYIPLTNRVRGPYCKLRTKFFPVCLWPKHEARRP